jgi:predicted HAD superfamily Cof-like phosphohydrolase
MSIETLPSVQDWQRAACPQPTPETMSKGLGYFLEEFNETLKAVKLDEAHDHLRRDAWTLLEHLAHSLKAGQASVVAMDRAEVIDGLADTIVTAVGFGYRAGMNVPEATERVNRANWAKYVGGVPLKNNAGKVIKPEGWVPPDHEGLY